MGCISLRIFACKLIPSRLRRSPRKVLQIGEPTDFRHNHDTYMPGVSEEELSLYREKALADAALTSYSDRDSINSNTKDRFRKGGWLVQNEVVVS